jgi:predicted dehydrogenase
VEQNETGRRDFLKAGAAALTTSIFTGNVKGANDRIAGAVIGIGRMGSENLRFAIRQPGVEVVAVSDIYKPHLADGLAIAAELGAKTKAVTDFREILADKSIDFVNISTPDHWHAYMTVEACKAGKDVYVEKPLASHIEEGLKMVEAARKYNRVVQAGTMQRSGDHFKKAVEIVKSGALGKITLCRTWINGLSLPEGIGNPPDCAPPEGLDWDMWLGPAPKRPFNPNRWGVHPEMGDKRPFPYFRYFWDYAGGMMTDWGVHLIDPIHSAMGEPMPKSVSALGGKWYVTDNRDTPDTLTVNYEYPGDFILTFESLTATSQSPHPASNAGTLYCGTRGQMFVSRRGIQVTPENGSDLEAQEIKPTNNMNMAHWANFIDCIRTRQKPTSDIETCFRSTAACQLANISYRSKLRLDWDAAHSTVMQKEARPYLAANDRKPWRLEV